eukprot:gene10525-12893_t
MLTGTPVSTRRPSTTPTTPLPTGESKSLTAGMLIPCASAARTTAWARGCSEARSIPAARRSSSSRSNPSRATTWVTEGRPSVRVPVLSKITVSISASTSTACSLRTSTPWRASRPADVSIAAGESVSDLLLQLKEKSLSATDKSLTTAARTALNEDFKAIRDQITTVVTNAKFNGVNLLDNSTGTGGYKALSNTAGSTIKVSGENLSLGGTNVTVAATTTIGTATL